MTTEQKILRLCRTMAKAQWNGFEDLHDHMDILAWILFQGFEATFSKEDGKRLEDELAKLRRLLESTTQ